MPSVAKGAHAFRPSNQSQGPIHSLQVTNTAANDNLNDILSDNSGTELPPLSSPLTTSPPALPSPSPSASATAFFSNNSISSSIAPSASISTSVVSESSASSKRKRSAVDDEFLAAPASQAGSRGKGRTSAGAFALQGIKGEIESFNETLRERGQRPLTDSQRKSKAMEQLHDPGLELDDDRLIAMMQLFKSDTDAADMFLAMKRESTRKTWIQSELLKLGLSTTDTSMQD